MTVSELIAVLQTLPADAVVKAFVPFDPDGPESWEELLIAQSGQEVRLMGEGCRGGSQGEFVAMPWQSGRHKCTS